MNMDITAVNATLLGLRYSGQLSTSPTIKDSKMQNWESKPKESKDNFITWTEVQRRDVYIICKEHSPRARNIIIKRTDQKTLGVSWRTTSGKTMKAKPGPDLTTSPISTP